MLNNILFLCSEETSADRSFRLILLRILPLAILFHEFVRKYPGNSGIVPFSHGDAGRGDGSVLCYSSNQKNHKLIPDSDYLYRHGYSDFKEQLKSSPVCWEKRKPVAYWRGSSTGQKSRDDAWREMPRFQLCQFALDSAYKDFFDIKITRITNRFTSPEVIQEIKNSGFMAAYEPAIDQVKYKYLIDIDGHGCTWTGLFLRLLTSSTLIRVISSNGYKQWFYDRLIPWENYVPVKEDLSDLEDVVVYLTNHDQKAKAIGEAGKKLAFSMTLENEIEMALPVITYGSVI